jgi:hypothetical protein
MTTMTPEPGSVAGGVDAQLDLHVAAAVNHLGAVFATKAFLPRRPATGGCWAGLARSCRCMRSESGERAATGPR